MKVCFQGATGEATDLKQCNPELTVLPCASVVPVAGGGVLVTLVDSASDPRVHVIDTLGVLEENPKSFATKGTVGKVFKIKGTSAPRRSARTPHRRLHLV